MKFYTKISLTISTIFLLVSCSEDITSLPLEISMDIQENEIMDKSLSLQNDSVTYGNTEEKTEKTLYFRTISELKEYIKSNSIVSVVQDPFLQEAKIDTISFASYSDYLQFVEKNNISKVDELENIGKTQEILTKSGEEVVEDVLRYFTWVFTKITKTGYSKSTRVQTESIGYVDSRHGFSGRYVAEVHKVELTFYPHSIDEFFTEDSPECGFMSNPIYGGGFWYCERGYAAEILNNGQVRLTTFLVKLNKIGWKPCSPENLSWTYWNYVYKEVSLPIVITLPPGIRYGD